MFLQQIEATSKLEGDPQWSLYWHTAFNKGLKRWNFQWSSGHQRSVFPCKDAEQLLPRVFFTCDRPWKLIELAIFWHDEAWYFWPKPRVMTQKLIISGPHITNSSRQKPWIVGLGDVNILLNWTFPCQYANFGSMRCISILYFYKWMTFNK